MNITALIKISAEIPQGAISQATGEYLLSMAEAEREHNARVAFLSERGSRVASQPSEYWQRAYSALKFATQEGRTAESTLEILDILAESAPSFDGRVGSLIRLAYSNPQLRPLILKTAEQSSTSQSALRGQGVAKKRTQNRAPKGEGKGAKRLTDKADKKKSKKQKLIYLKNMYEKAKDGATKTRVTKQMIRMIRGQEGTRKNKRLLKILQEWEGYENGSIKVTSPTTKDADGKPVEVQWGTLNSSDKDEDKAYAEEIKEKVYLSKLFNLAKLVASQEGGGKKKEDGAKADGAPKKEDGSGSEEGKKEKPKTDAEKAKDFIDGADSPEQKKERQELVKEKGVEDAQAITFGGDQEEEDGDSPDPDETATGTNVDVGNVSSSGGQGRKKKNKGKKNKGKKRRGPQVGLRGTPQQFQNPSAGKVRAKKASEEDLLSSESLSDYSSTDFDIIF